MEPTGNEGSDEVKHSQTFHNTPAARDPRERTAPEPATTSAVARWGRPPRALGRLSAWLAAGPGLIALLACSQRATQTSPTGQSEAALERAAAEDVRAVEACREVAARCALRLTGDPSDYDDPDAGEPTGCAGRVARCDRLENHFASLLDPVRTCVESRRGCDEASEGRCGLGQGQCEALMSAAEEARAPLVRCQARVAACLSRGAEDAGPPTRACENMQAACDRMAEAGNTHARAPDRADRADDGDDDDDLDESLGTPDDAEQAEAAEGAEGDDEADDDEEEADDDSGPQGARGNAPADTPRGNGTPGGDRSEGAQG